MNVTEIDNNIVLEGVKCLDLGLTLDCGQAFRWEKQDDGSWSGAAKGVFLNIKEDGGRFILKNTTEEIYNKVWKNYFDFDRDYEKNLQKADERPASFKNG